jgi:predicted transcriptional regulator
MITFKKIKNLVYKSYEEISRSKEKDILQSKDMSELLNILDGLGFNGVEAYNFIFDAIIKPEKSKAK